MNEGNVTNITPFIQIVKQQIERIKENLQDVLSSYFERIQAELYEAAKQTAGVEYLNYEQQQAVTRQAQEESVQNLARRFAKNEKDRELVLGAIPIRKVIDHLHFHFDKIAKKYFYKW
jgi:aspartokinase